MRTTTLRRGGVLAATLALTLTALPATAAEPLPTGGTALPLAEAGPLHGWGAAAAAVPASLAGQAVTAVSASGGYTLALKADGTVAAWLTGGGDDARAAVQVPAGLRDVVAVEAGNGNPLALRADGTVVAWGSAGWGITSVPATVRNAVAISAQARTALAVLADGTVVAWGQRSTGAYAPPAGLRDVVAVATSDHTQMALKADGTVVTWGTNFDDGFTDTLTVPATIQGRVRQIGLQGSTVAYAITDDGAVHVWGRPPGTRPVTTPLDGLDVVQVEADDASVLALTAEGDVVHFQSGFSTQPIPVPAEVTDGRATAIASNNASLASSIAGYAITADLAVATAPAITGTPRVGQTLALTQARFSGNPDAVAIQWYTGAGASAQPIAGATGTTLPLTDALLGQTITVRQTATQGARTATATSAATAAVAPAIVASTLRASSRASAYGTAPVLTLTATPATAAGPIEVRRGSAVIARGTLAGGRATLRLPATALAPGRHALSVRYAGNATTAPAVAALTHTVAKAATRTTAKAKTRKIIAKRTRGVLVVTVSATGTKPTGKVTVLQGRKKVGTATVRGGKATVKLAKLAKAGRARLTVKYAGSALTAASTGKVTVTVRKR